MARFTQPARSTFDDPEDLAGYDAVVERCRIQGIADEADPALGAPHVGEYWGGLLNSPMLTGIASTMGTFVRRAGERDNSYTHAQREFVDQVLSADQKSNVVQGWHIADGVAAGVRLEAVEALRYGHEEDLNEEEQLLTRFIRQTVSGSVDDGTLGSMKDLMGDRGVIEYAAFVLWLNWIMRMMQLIDSGSPTDEEVDAQIRALKEGSLTVPDFRERLN
jgi:hypothetical protein